MINKTTFIGLLKSDLSGFADVRKSGGHHPPPMVFLGTSAQIYLVIRFGAAKPMPGKSYKTAGTFDFV
jgi:hypothetical protein